jgi:hypothetical protein
VAAIPANPVGSTIETAVIIAFAHSTSYAFSSSQVDAALAIPVGSRVSKSKSDSPFEA